MQYIKPVNPDYNVGNPTPRVLLYSNMAGDVAWQRCFVVTAGIRLANFSIIAENGLETKISRTFLDFLHLGHEFFVISGHGT